MTLFLLLATNVLLIWALVQLHRARRTIASQKEVISTGADYIAVLEAANREKKNLS